jgi:hypothetical protein
MVPGTGEGKLRMKREKLRMNEGLEVDYEEVVPDTEGGLKN